ncbi:MAG: hypothetical protein HQM08_19490 [Candidatus Riflebacteria bacterium]|nr:hypothetical protein [Candidatus Riflebacteria bacterium]
MTLRDKIFISRRVGGVFLIILVSIISILSILSLALFRTLSEKNMTINYCFNSSIMDLAAMEIAGGVFENVGKKLSIPSSSLFQSLVSADLRSFPISIVQSELIPEQPFSFSGVPIFSGITHQVEGSFVDCAPLNPALNWHDPKEKMCKLRIQISIGLGRLPYRRVQKSYVFSKFCKVQSLSLPVISRFSLFVREPEKTNETEEGYNRFRNYISGAPIDGENNLPFIVYNTTEVRQVDYSRTGHIFLGGTDDIQLHLTPGIQDRYGEYFHFFNINRNEIRNPGFLPTTLPPTEAFSSRVRISLYQDITARFSLQGMFSGFYERNTSDPPSDMNFRGCLDAFFSETNGRTFKSSSLHLFGSTSNRSPTLVVGKVYRVFPKYMGLKVDMGERGVFPVSLLRTPPQFLSSSGSEYQFWGAVELPRTSINIGNGSRITIDGISIRELFENTREYLRNASGLIFEPFNKVWDYLRNESGRFPPSQVFAGENGNSLLVDSSNYSISRAENGSQLFRGELNQVGSEELIKDRPTYICENQRDFEANFVNAGEINLRGQFVYVKNGPLEIPEAVVFSKPGLLAVNGELIIKGDIKTSQDGVSLSLISVGGNGNITLTGTNQELNCALVALDGTIRTSSLSNSPRIFGFVAAKKFKPSDWPSGGELTYNPSWNPSRGDNERYLVNLSDNYTNWEIQK